MKLYRNVKYEFDADFEPVKLSEILENEKIKFIKEQLNASILGYCTLNRDVNVNKAVFEEMKPLKFHPLSSGCSLMISSVNDGSVPVIIEEQYPFPTSIIYVDMVELYVEE